MKTNIKDIIKDNVIKTVKNHIESYVYDDVMIGDIDKALNYNYSDDVIEYVLKNGIMEKLYMIKYNVKKY
jgi:hypothetical protein